MMRSTRRTFLRHLTWLAGSVTGLVGLASCTPAPPASPGPARLYRVGLLREPSGSTTDPEGVTATAQLRARLGELGYVEGQNLVFETRNASGDFAEFDEVAAEVARLPVDVIVTSSAAWVRAAMAATGSIPIVIMGGVNPVEEGFVQSLPRPGGNVTGVAHPPPEVDLKRLQLLVEAAPRVSRVAILGGFGFGMVSRPEAPGAPAVAGRDPTVPDADWEAAARSLGVSLVGVPFQSRDRFEEAVEAAIAQGADGLLLRQPTVIRNMDIVRRVLTRHPLPSICEARMWTMGDNGLMEYSARGSLVQRRAAEFVDRILRGERPANLPVEMPTSYRLSVSLRAAQNLGLTLSPAFRARVDEFME